MEQQAKQKAEKEQQMADMKQKMEEMKQKKEEEMAKKKEEQEKRMAATKVTTEIRKYLMVFRQANVGNFEDLKRQLDEKLEKELEGCGEFAEKVTQEAEQAVKMVTARLQA